MARVLTERAEDEHWALFVWRRDELKRAGYPDHVAARLADDETVDLERARKLLEKGASVEVALAILL